MRRVAKLAAFAFALGATPVHAADSTATDLGTLDKDAVAQRVVKAPGYSPYAGRKFPTRPFFGDTHLHTALSLDARAFGNTLGPEEAYRFARGEEVVGGMPQARDDGRRRRRSQGRVAYRHNVTLRP